MKLSIAALALALSAFAAPALAQDVKSTEPVTIYDKWEEELVPGDLVRAGGELVAGKVIKKTSGTLVKVRSHFIPELLKSVEKL